MNTPNPHPLNKASQALAAVRRKIEREFSWLLQAHSRLLHLVLNEAEAVAWETGFPQLVFPVLAQEKVRQLALWHSRQQSIRQTGLRLRPS